MKIPITNTDNRYADLSFDRYGNIYFEYDGTTYQVSIDGKNTPSIEPGEFQTLDEVTKYKKLLLQEENKEDEDCCDSSEEDEPDYLEEDEEYMIEDYDNHSEVEYDVDNIEKYGESNKPFNFSAPSSVDDILITDRMNGDITALYDTFIYKNNGLTFVASSQEEESIYRFRINDDGGMTFRPIGGSELFYGLMIDDGKLTLKNILF